MAATLRLAKALAGLAPKAETASHAKLHFSFDGVRHEGFAVPHCSADLIGRIVVMLWVEGIPEVWIAEDIAAATDLVEVYSKWTEGRLDNFNLLTPTA